MTAKWATTLGAVVLTAVVLAPAGPATAAPNPATITLGASQGLPSIASLTGIACEAPTTCVAVGDNDSGIGSGAVSKVVNGIAGAPVNVSSVQIFGGVACASTTTCYAAGSVGSLTDGAIVTITNGVVGAVQVVSTVNSLTGIACASATVCVAVGFGNKARPTGSGFVVPIVNGTAGAGVPDLAVDRFYGVACTPGGASAPCYAVAQTGISATEVPSVVPITAGVAGVPQAGVTGTRLIAITCPTATGCLAAGDTSGNTGIIQPVVSGTPGAPQTVAGTETLYGIGCAAANACAAGGVVSPAGGVLVPIGAGVADPVVVVGGIFNYVNSIACPSATECLAAGQGSDGGALVPFTLAAPLAVATTSLPGGHVGTAYSATLSASGGTSPDTWSLAAGSSLPPGLTLSPAGVISGTPTQTGTTSFTVQVTDSSSPPQVATASESITVSQASPPSFFATLFALILALLHLLFR